MSEQLFGNAWHQLCENLLAIRNSGSWKAYASCFEEYATRRWSLSKSRTRLYCKFAKFTLMCRDAKLPIADSPDNVAPILGLQQGRWLDIWQLARSHDAINADSIKGLMAHFGIASHKRIPAHIQKGMKVRKAAKTLAEFEDGEALVDDIGPDALGKHWKKATEVVIDADQRAMTEERG